MSLSRLRNKGIALVVVLLALLVVGSVAGGLVLVSSNHLMHASSNNEGLEALYAARSGAMIKLGQLRSKDLNAISGKLPQSGASYSATVTFGGDPKGKPKSKSSFPPLGTYYIESTGTSAQGKTRRVGILASISESRWNHAAFGNQEVVMKAGSYTDSFNSDGLGFSHSDASIATNNPIDGIKIEDHESVVIGWSAADDPKTGKKKKKKDKKAGGDKLTAEADVQGPPGSTEKVVVGGKDANKSYNSFVTGGQTANMDPVVVPTTIADGTVGAVIDPLVSTRPTVQVVGMPTLIPPGAYHILDVDAGGSAVLDVSTLAPGSEAEYVFHGIDLDNGNLTIKQPPTGNPVTVKVYIDTGDGTDPTTGVKMVGSSLVNPNSKPINMQLLIAGKGKNLLEGHDDLKDGLGPPSAYYVAYGPEATIQINRGQVYGSVVADQVVLDGESLTDPDKSPAVIHFDTTLLEDTGNPPVFNILSIRYF